MKFRSRSFVEKKKVKRKLFFWLSGFSVVALISFFFWFIYADIFQIKESVIQGNSYVEESKIREIIDRNISQKTLGFIPHTNILFYPKTEIINEITSIAPVKSVKYSRADNAVLFHIEERKPSYVYCEGAYPATDACYFADESGFVFLESPTFNNYPYLRLYSGNSHATPSIGSVVIDQKIINFSQSIITYLNDKNIQADAITVDMSSTFFTVHIDSSKILISKKDTIELFTSKFEAVTKDKDASGYIQSLEYLDLRLNTKVFLKEK